MPQPPASRSVKIDQDERGGWSSDRPRPGGRPARPADLTVRGRVLAPSDRIRYSPGSLVLVVSPAVDERERFVARVVEEKGSVLSLAKVRGLLAGKVAEGDVEAKATELLDAAVGKRLDAGASVVLVADTMDPAERERHLRAAAARRRPRHLVLLEAGRDGVSEDDRAELNGLRQALEAGRLGDEGFHTALRLGGRAVEDVKRIVFRPEQADDE
jgi:hypothetical protein